MISPVEFLTTKIERFLYTVLNFGKILPLVYWLQTVLNKDEIVYKLLQATTPSHLETCSNKLFEDFFFDTNGGAPDYLEVLKISFRDVRTSVSLCSQLKADLRLATRLDVSVMDFSNLCWIDLITPTDLKCHVVKV